MSITTKSRDVGLAVVGFGLLIGVLALGMVLLEGIAAFSVWVLHWTFPAFLITLLVSFFLLVLALIPQTRVMSAIGFLLASFAFGTILWLWGMAYTFSTWGLVGVVAGLFLGGVGVIPVAMLAALVRGDWGNLGLFIGSAVLTLGLRVLAQWLGHKVDERAARRSDITVRAVQVPD